MKRLFSFLAAALVLAGVPARGASEVSTVGVSAPEAPATGTEDLLPAIAKAFDGNSVALSFECRTGDSSLGDGTALLSASAYKFITAITEFWCDGTSRWMVDRVAEEVVIEPVEGDLASVLSSLRESYPFDATFEGRRATAVRFAPDSEVDASGSTGNPGADEDLNFGGMQDLTIYRDPGTGHILGCTVSLGGAPFTFVIKSIKVTPLTGTESFAFPTATLSDYYIVTDLR